MLIEDIYKIENNLQKIVDNYVNTFSNKKISISIDECNNKFYLVDKLDYDDYFRSGTVYYYRQNGYFNYGLFNDYYYDCEKDIFIQSIKNKIYHVYDYDTLIKIISSNIANKEKDRKIYIALDKLLISRQLLKNLRKKIKSSTDLDNTLSCLANLYPTYEILFNKFKFYIICREYEVFNLFYKNFSIGVGFDINIYIYNTKINITKFLNKIVNFIYKQATKLFNTNLKLSEFIAIESNYLKCDNYTHFILTLVFRMHNFKQLIYISILDDLCKYI